MKSSRLALSSRQNAPSATLSKQISLCCAGGGKATGQGEGLNIILPPPLIFRGRDSSSRLYQLLPSTSPRQSCCCVFQMLLLFSGANRTSKEELNQHLWPHQHWRTWRPVPHLTPIGADQTQGCHFSFPLGAEGGQKHFFLVGTGNYSDTLGGRLYLLHTRNIPRAVKLSTTAAMIMAT